MTIKLLDVTNWARVSDGFIESMYPEGSLSKFLLLNEGNQYLFKETWIRNKCNYYDEEKCQFWSEIIAAEVAEIMKLDVPKTYVAVNNNDDISFNVGVLSKWFLEKKDKYIKGSELLTRFINNYNEKNYNLTSCIEVTSNVQGHLEYWMQLMLFDALIGNTDRHHENWGLINDTKLTPLFDNGISLGWREKESEFSETKIEKQWLKFQFKMKLSEFNNSKKVIDVISLFKNKYNVQHVSILSFINRFSEAKIKKIWKQIEDIEYTIPEQYLLSNIS